MTEGKKSAIRNQHNNQLDLIMKGFLSALRWSTLTCEVFLALAVLAAAPQARAQIVNLTDGNSVAQINVGSQAGMFNWSVSGLSQLTQQWFWYRLGSTGPQASIDTVSAPTVVLTGTRGLTTTYANNNFSISIDYLLTGGTMVAPGQTANSDIGETIRIINTSQTVLPFHFFQYSDFDLGGPGGDTVQLGKNLFGLYNEAYQTDGAGAALTETVTTPGANRGEAAFFNATLVALNTVPGYILDNNAGPVGPGDVTWALQWDFNLNPGASFIISKDKFLSVLIPEPSVLALVGLGVVSLLLRRRRL